MDEPTLTAAQTRKARRIAAVASPLAAMLTATWRSSVHGVPALDPLFTSPRQPILAFWHGRILGGIHFFRHRGIVVITSRNFDGEWIARIIHRFGFGSARGSSSRGGPRALVQLRRDLQAGRAVAFTVDGPRGPARVAQPGAVWLAGATGHPLVPFHLEADRYWETRSWDRALIPKPFSRVALVVGEPIQVPDTAEATIEAGRRQLEDVLADLEARALALVGRAREPRPAGVETNAS
jgi:lysophospholipid acyltransferase (LPLAT)-like uncharacterized protein